MSVPPNPALQLLVPPAQGRFPAGSRYAGIAVRALVQEGGTVLRYLARRFLPPAAGLATLVEHPVVDGERLDILSARYLGAAHQFWRICDANVVLHPAELEVVGEIVRITLPAGVSGPSRA